MGLSGVKWSEVKCVEWSVEWSEVEWSRVRGVGVEWSGVRGVGVKWS